MKVKSLDFHVEVKSFRGMGIYSKVDEKTTIRRSITPNQIRGWYTTYVAEMGEGKSPELMSDCELVAWCLEGGVAESFNAHADSNNSFAIEHSNIEELKDSLLRKFITDCIFDHPADINIRFDK